MTKFSYIATNSAHQSITGTTDQADRASVIAALKKQELRPISIKEVSAIALKGFSLDHLMNTNKVK
jgi:type II secretory pathway component PulF